LINYTLQPSTALSKRSLLLTILITVQTETPLVLPTDAIFAFAPGLVACLDGGTPPNCDFSFEDVFGSYFAMDLNNNGTFTANGKIAF